jgi:putative sigma-54 modulation protein
LKNHYFQVKPLYVLTERRLIFMKLQVTAKNTEVSHDIEDSIRMKLMEFSDNIDMNKTVQVKIEEVKLQYRMEIMFSFNGMYIKADVKEKSIKRALNRALDKIERKINKIEYKQSTQFSEELGRLSAFNQESEEEEEDRPFISRRKKFGIKPMTEEEAMLQMELLGHEFFMFYNGDVDSMCLIYKRKDGNYGLIESVG